MDEKIIKIVASKLKSFEGEPINQEKLAAIREAVFKATKTNKSASFVNVKKWIKEARSYAKQKEKEAAKSNAKPSAKKVTLLPAEAVREEREPEIPVVSRRVEESVNMIKDEASPALQEVNLPKPTIVFDKVYLQSIKFEIAGIRQTMERVSRQLDRLEKELSSHGDD